MGQKVGNQRSILGGKKKSSRKLEQLDFYQLERDRLVKAVSVNERSLFKPGAITFLSLLLHKLSDGPPKKGC